MDMAFGKFHFRVGKEGSHRLARSDSARSGAAGSGSSGSVSSFESGDEEISSTIFTKLASSGELIKIFSNISVGSSADSDISSDSDSVGVSISSTDLLLFEQVFSLEEDIHAAARRINPTATPSPSSTAPPVATRPRPSRSSPRPPPPPPHPHPPPPKPKRPEAEQPPHEEPAAAAGKYWTHRHSLFSLYDRGVLMDAEGWYVLRHPGGHRRRAGRPCLPRRPRRRRARRRRRQRHQVRSQALADELFVFRFQVTSLPSPANPVAGISCRGCYVIAVEIDPRKVELARHNARIYGVEDMIEFVVGDFFRLAPALKDELLRNNLELENLKTTCATSFSSKMHAGDPEDNSSEILCLYCNNEHD
ncbi:hypothetical protein QYE76_037032 [Lolium multiflorum]|uniref:Trimethylguanosine synthase n=1 Tax=Lolium multiflorum TaxID=4521 RepID=A0AAD8R4P7_LOLMU|nr:hypothetical protein QYE76_037032 [Lolium multiflorum]